MNRTFTYTVQGAGRFPIDMLRYDRAWPTTAEDSVLIGEDVMNSDTVREITVTGASMPSSLRWKSFGWNVSAKIRLSAKRAKRFD